MRHFAQHYLQVPATVEPWQRKLATWTALVVIALDQATKIWALHGLSHGQVVPLLGKYLSLQLVHNPGAAFSLGGSSTWVFSVVAIIVVAVIAWTIRRPQSHATVLCLGFLAGGAVGNLIDRIVRPPAIGRGHVVDFIAYADFFVGNVADIFIVVAAVALVFLSIRMPESAGTGVQSKKADEL